MEYSKIYVPDKLKDLSEYNGYTLDKLCNLFTGTARIYVESYNGYQNPEIYIASMRLETDNEFDKRVKKLKQAEEKKLIKELKKEERERKLFNTLKEKYGE